MFLKNKITLEVRSVSVLLSSTSGRNAHDAFFLALLSGSTHIHRLLETWITSFNWFAVCFWSHNFTSAALCNITPATSRGQMLSASIPHSFSVPAERATTTRITIRAKIRSTIGPNSSSLREILISTFWQKFWSWFEFVMNFLHFFLTKFKIISSYHEKTW